MEFSPFALNQSLRRRLLSEFEGSTDLLLNETFLSNLELWLSSAPQFSSLRVSTHIISVKEAESKLKELLEKICYKKFGTNCLLPSVYPHPVVPGVLIVECIKRLNVQPCPKEIIVDHVCGSAVLRGADVYIPGVKGSPRVVEKGEHVAVYADLSSRCLKGWITPYEGNKVFLGNGIMHCDRQELIQLGNRGIAVEMTETISNHLPFQQEDLRCDLFLQNLPSIMSSHILNPSPGDWILDMCAAPGGKTTSLGILMKNQGVIVALDRKKKINQIRDNAKRFHLSCIHVYPLDSTQALDTSKASENAVTLRKSGSIPVPPFPCQLFDHVLLDAPCSALGQRPQLVNSMTPDELSSYPCLQKKLFRVAFELLKDGGSLVYCTCTLTIAENEGMVKWALEKYPNLYLQPQVPHIGGTGLPVDGLSKDQLSMLQRFQPDFKSVDRLRSDVDTIGFFIAKFVKASN